MSLQAIVQTVLIDAFVNSNFIRYENQKINALRYDLAE